MKIISGYFSKNIASYVFVANRTIAFTAKTDTNFFPIKIAKDQVHTSDKSATANVLRLVTRKAFFREGLGGVLGLEKEYFKKKYLAPKRSIFDNEIPFPYGNTP